MMAFGHCMLDGQFDLIEHTCAYAWWAHRCSCVISRSRSPLDYLDLIFDLVYSGEKI